MRDREQPGASENQARFKVLNLEMKDILDIEGYRQY